MNRSDFFTAKLAGGIYDRIYGSSDFARRWAQTMTNGVLPDVFLTTELEVSKVPGTMQSSVNLGVANINGYFFEIYTNAELLSHDSGDATLNRYDRIVLELDLTETGREIKVKIIKSANAVNPTRPELIRNASYWQLSLASIYIPAGTTSLDGLTIVDERMDAALCGLCSVKMLLSAFANPTFEGHVTIDTPTNPTDAARKDYVDLRDAQNVKLTTNQTVGGTKEFLASPIVPTPTANAQAANKSYVDEKDSANVKITGIQTVAGVKMFSSSPNVPTPTLSNHAANKSYIDVQDSFNVKMTGNQSVAGVKTFSSSPIVPTPTLANHAANRGYVDVQDSFNVKMTGNQTVAGVKTFSSSPIVPTPTTSFQATPKGYVDPLVTGINSTISTLDAANVKLTGNQTVAGVKTFSSSPIVPTPTAAAQAAPKNYVDGEISKCYFLNNVSFDFSEADFILYHNKTLFVANGFSNGAGWPVGTSTHGFMEIYYYNGSSFAPAGPLCRCGLQKFWPYNTGTPCKRTWSSDNGFGLWETL